MEKTTADVTIKRVMHDLPIFETSNIKVRGFSIAEDGGKEISFAYNGATFDFIDLKTNELTRLDSPSYVKLSRTGIMQYGLLAVAPYWQKDPFAMLLTNLKDAEKLADTIIFNVPCYQVKLTMETTNEVTGRVAFSSIWFIDKEQYLIRGLITRNDKQFLKIRSVNENPSTAFFSLTQLQDVKKITGMEPISEGLLDIGSTAPDWTLPSSKNKLIRMKELRGKIVLMDFWGTWCVPCLKAMPEIQAIRDHFKKDPVEVLGVSVETEKNADPVGYMKRKQYTYTTLLDGKKITEDYKVNIFPTIYIIDKNGMVIHAEYGGNRENFREDIIKKIQDALNR